MTDEMLTGEELRYRTLMADVFRGLEADDVALGARDRIRIDHGDGSRLYTLTQETYDEITEDAVDIAYERMADPDDAIDADDVARTVDELVLDGPEDLPTEEELEEWQDPIEDLKPALVSDGFMHAEYVDTGEYERWQEDGVDAFLDHPDDGYKQWYEDTVKNLERMDYDRPEQLLIDVANLPYTGTGHPPSQTAEPVHSVPDKGLLQRLRDRF